MSVQYSAMDVYQLLFELWLTYEEIECMRELIQIDNQPHYWLKDVNFIKKLMKFQFILQTFGLPLFRLFFLFVYAIKT